MVSYNDSNNLSKEQVRDLLQQLSGPYWLMGALLYSCGLHPVECVKLRVKDLDLSNGRLQIHKHLPVILAPQLIPHLKLHLSRIRTQHLKALAQGDGWVITTEAPYTSRDWLMQFVFAAPGASVNQNQRKIKQPFPEQRLLSSIHSAAQLLSFYQPISAFDLRRALAHHLVDSGCSVQSMRQHLRLMRKKSNISTHNPGDNGSGVNGTTNKEHTLRVSDDYSYRDQIAIQNVFRDIFSPRLLGQKQHPDFVSEPAAAYRIAS